MGFYFINTNIWQNSTPIWNVSMEFCKRSLNKLTPLVKVPLFYTNASKKS